jgi:hypothetical protein
MLVDPDNKPRIGTVSKCLGVREPPAAYADVDLDVVGNVIQNRKGMSVSDSWKTLPPHLIPEQLDDGLNGASGKGMNVFVHGTGPFDEGAIGTDLELFHKLGSATMGIVGPAALVSLAHFQQSLAATREDWHIDVN